MAVACFGDSFADEAPLRCDSPHLEANESIYDATKAGVFHCSLPFRSFETLKAKVTEKKKLWLEHLFEVKQRGEEVAVWPENLNEPGKLLHED